MFSKKVDRLQEWLLQTEELEVTELTSFVNGIRRDLCAVENAIIHPYNNGLAEGSVNK